MALELACGAEDGAKPPTFLNGFRGPRGRPQRPKVPGRRCCGDVPLCCPGQLEEPHSVHEARRRPAGLGRHMPPAWRRRGPLATHFKGILTYFQGTLRYLYLQLFFLYAWFLGRPEIVYFWGLGSPGPQQTFQQVFWKGFLGRRDRRIPTNRRFTDGPKAMYETSKCT